MDLIEGIKTNVPIDADSNRQADGLWEMDLIEGIKTGFPRIRYIDN